MLVGLVTILISFGVEMLFPYCFVDYCFIDIIVYIVRNHCYTTMKRTFPVAFALCTGTESAATTLKRNKIRNSFDLWRVNDLVLLVTDYLEDSEAVYVFQTESYLHKLQHFYSCKNYIPLSKLSTPNTTCNYIVKKLLIDTETISECILPSCLTHVKFGESFIYDRPLDECKLPL